MFKNKKETVGEKMEIAKVVLTALLSVAALFAITKIMGHKQVASSRSLLTVGRQSFPTSGFPAVKYGSLPEKRTHSQFVSAAKLSTTGITSTTV